MKQDNITSFFGHPAAGELGELFQAFTNLGSYSCGFLASQVTGSDKGIPGVACSLKSREFWIYIYIYVKFQHIVESNSV